MPNDPPQAPHAGMPPFDQTGKPLSFFEFLPMWAFDPPVLVDVLWLMLRFRGAMLPTVANPSFPGGGLVGESKAAILDLAVTHIPNGLPLLLPSSDQQSWMTCSSQRTLLKDVLPRWNTKVWPCQRWPKPDLGCRGAGWRW